VRVYTWNGISWIRRGNDIDGESAGDLSGYSAALSNKGNTLVIGTPGNNGFTGRVRIYSWNGTLGSQGFGNLGTHTTDTGDINTAGAFTLTDVRSTASKTGYFTNFASFSQLGSLSFNTSVGTSLRFYHPALGTFVSNSITTTSNISTPGKVRNITIIGTLSGGTLGNISPNNIPVRLAVSFTQSGAAISSSINLNLGQ
jgi:hypothetical protein